MDWSDDSLVFCALLKEHLEAVNDELNILEVETPGLLGSQWDNKKVESEWESAQSLGAFNGQNHLRAFIFYRVNGVILEVSLLATLKGYQKKGFMNQLLTRLISQHESLQEIWLELAKNNVSARKFYEKFGFIHVGERASYYRDGQDALLMTKFINKVLK